MTKIDVKNLKINKKLATGIGGIVLVGGLVGVALFNKNDKPIIDNTPSFEETLEKNKDNTYLDEVLENIGSSDLSLVGDLNYIILKPYGFLYEGANICDEEFDIIDWITKLELGFELHRYIENTKFLNDKEFNDINEETYKEILININNADVKDYVMELINIINDKNTTDVEKARSAQKLNYINNYYEHFISKNGLVITDNLIKKTLIACASNVSGLEPIFADNCDIFNSTFNKKILVTDPVSGISFTYYITNKSGILEDVCNSLREINSLYNERTYLKKDLEFDDIEKVCIPALNNIKKLVNSNVKLHDNILSAVTKKEKIKTK